MLRNKSNELIFGLVAPLGIDLDAVIEIMERVLSDCAYSTVRISLSEFLHRYTNVFDGEVPKELDAYIDKHQAAGKKLRNDMERDEAVALGGLMRINALRKETQKSGDWSNRTAFVVRQFETPAEIELMRKVYGDRFVLVGVYAREEYRTTWLSKRIHKSKNKKDEAWTQEEGNAKRLIKNDEAENDSGGKRFRDTFPLADVFTSWAANMDGVEEVHDKSFELQFQRFVHGLFGRPDIVPTTEEVLMFQARAMALRSADWSRQVGAVIATRAGSVIAVGRNDDPQVGGGVVSRRPKDDPAIPLKWDVVNEVLKKISSWLKPEFAADLSALTEEATAKTLKSTRLMGMGEFGRMVHAEMAAIVDAAARGIAVGGEIMFCTTFPCQNCAKHLMAAGIRALVYIEPYPKSFVNAMYGEETISLPMEPLQSDAFQKYIDELGVKKFLLLTFMGIAPRRYEQLFTMPDRKGPAGSQIGWDPKIAEPRLASPLESEEYFAWELSESKALIPYLKA